MGASHTLVIEFLLLRYVLFARLELKLEMLIYLTKTNAVVDLGSGMQQQQPETFV